MIVESLQPEEHFHLIWDGLEEAISHSGGYVTVGQVHDQLRMRNWRLFLVYSEGEYAGFGIAEPLPLANGMWLNIPFAYATNGLYLEFFAHMAEISRENGMAGVKFVSGRSGFERVAKKYGWKPGFREYIVEDFRGKE
jgi:hypothetical protein